MEEKVSTDEILIGLVSISDRASAGVYEDLGIPALKEWCASAITTPVKIETRLIPDDRFTIEKTLRELCDDRKCDLILTTGGTGPSRRDVTPEATRAVATRELPGFGEQMRAISLKFVPTAILSRQTAVLREIPDHAALIINLPGQPKAIAETLGGVTDREGNAVPGIFAAVPYCIDLIGGPYVETNPDICRAFRPKAALKAREEELQRRREEAAKSEAGETDASVPQQTPSRPYVDPSPVRIPGNRPAPEEKKPASGLDTFILSPTDSGAPPPCTVIWLGSMGMDAHEFAELPSQIYEFGGPAAQYVMVNAPVRTLASAPGKPVLAWYDIPGRTVIDHEDEAGIRQSAERIRLLIEEIEAGGMPRKRIFLAGFSQGASMALYAGLREKLGVAGIIALSGYLPLAGTLPKEIREGGLKTPVFMGHGAYDEIVPLPVAEQSARLISACGAKVFWHEYESEHDFGMDEVRQTAEFMRSILLR